MSRKEGRRAVLPSFSKAVFSRFPAAYAWSSSTSKSTVESSELSFELFRASGGGCLLLYRLRSLLCSCSLHFGSQRFHYIYIYDLYARSPVFTLATELRFFLSRFISLLPLFLCSLTSLFIKKKRKRAGF